MIRLVLCAGAPALGGCSGNPSVCDRAAAGDPRIFELDEGGLDQLLGRLCREEPDVRLRLRRLARMCVGQPNRLFLLGEFPFELYDPDPLYDLSAGDCVTFVEQTWAMALSCGWADFFDHLMRLRYRGGKIGLLTRNHFTEADWNRNNVWLFEEVTSALGGSEVVRYRQRLDRAAFFRRFRVPTEIPPEMIEDVYLPRAGLLARLDRLEDGDVLEIVRGPAEAPFVSHMGLIFHDAEGRATLLHSTRPAVREERLEDYMDRHDDVLGIKVMRRRPEGHY